METPLSEQIEQLEGMVERHLDLCQESWHGIRCTLSAGHESMEPHRFPVGERGEFQRIVTNAFDLPQVYREVFLLCDIQGFTIAKAAAMLSISPADARLRLNNARRAMHAWSRTAL